MNRGRSRLPLAILVAVVAAGVATFLLRPRSGLIEPAAVDVKGYFTAFQLERAEDFRSVQRLFGVGGLVAGTATLALLAWRPPRARLRPARPSARCSAGPCGAGISMLLELVDSDLRGQPRARARRRARDAGLADWLRHREVGRHRRRVRRRRRRARAALIRRFRRNWWAPSAAVIVAFGVVTIWLFPIVIDPLFNASSSCGRGHALRRARAGRAAGVDVGEVYRVDASRRTTAANAYVGDSATPSEWCSTTT